MVARIARRVAWSAAVLGCAALAARAQDNTLERMQTEVATVVKSARSAVVTIEDGRGTEARRAELNRTMTSAFREAQRKLRQELSEESRLAQKAGERSEEAAKAREQAMQHVAELQQKLSGLDKMIAEQVEMTLPLMEMEQPRIGSGFSIGEGLIITSADVLDGMKRPVVILDCQARVRATVVGVDRDLNVGLLRVPTEANIPALKLADSTSVQVGHFAICIGNQSGQCNSAALSIIAGLRSDGTFAGGHYYPSLIQVAGTVGDGASGSPLLNSHGEVIGMIAAVPAVDFHGMRPGAPGGFRVQMNQTGRGSPGDGGMSSLIIARPSVSSAGYAVPSNAVKQAVAQLRDGVGSAKGWIGITPEEVVRYVPQGALMTPVREVRVVTIFPNSPAARAGLMKDDVLLSMNGKPVENCTSVYSTSRSVRPGDMLNVVVRRTARTCTFTVKIDTRPQDVDVPNDKPGSNTKPRVPRIAPRPHNDEEPQSR